MAKFDPLHPFASSENAGNVLERWVDQLFSREFAVDSVLHEVILIAMMLLAGWLLWATLRLFLLHVIYPLIRRSETKWDDALLKQYFFRKLSVLAPLALFRAALPVVLFRHPGTAAMMITLVNILVVLMLYQAFAAAMNASREALRDTRKWRDKPLNSYVQLAKIIGGTIAAITLVSLLFEKNPIYIFSAMGAASAVLLLIFKDTILGFVASVQLSVNDMVHVGDWVQLEKYGADGEVTDISLATIKVRNWDMTYTMVPTYAFLSDAVKNWSGMQQSPGRRIKRSIFLKAGSIHFCTAEDLERYSRYTLVADYIRETQEEVDKRNKERGVDRSVAINGQNQTNVGVFRAYATAYLKHEPRVNQDMTLMVRQLDPTAQGLPLEIYCFSRNKEWVAYEGLASDLFDHLIAAATWFDLEVFQAPAGSDIRLPLEELIVKQGA